MIVATTQTASELRIWSVREIEPRRVQYWAGWQASGAALFTPNPQEAIVISSESAAGMIAELLDDYVPHGAVSRFTPVIVILADN